VKGVQFYEDDISAEKETEIKSPWLPQQDEYKGRQKSSPGQKSQGKKSSFRIMMFQESFAPLFETLFSRVEKHEVFGEFKKDQRFFHRLSEGKIRRKPDTGSVCSQKKER
jgi:hypothetical protein